MIPLPILNWAIMAVSLFNTILMLWLGLTILLNTERRTWGVWLTGSGLLMSGAFFVSHTAIFGYGLKAISRELDFCGAWAGCRSLYYRSAGIWPCSGIRGFGLIWKGIALSPYVDGSDRGCC